MQTISHTRPLKQVIRVVVVVSEFVDARQNMRMMLRKELDELAISGGITRSGDPGARLVTIIIRIVLQYCLQSTCSMGRQQSNVRTAGDLPVAMVDLTETKPWVASITSNELAKRSEVRKRSISASTPAPL